MPTDFDDSQTSSTRSVSDPMAEHKQRARWRLIGALAFSLASAAVAMVVLRDTPRPLSQDFILQMPPKPASVALAPVTPVAPVAPAPKVEPKAEPKVEPKAEPKPQPKPAPKVEPKVEPKAEPKVEPKAEPKSETKTAAKPEAKPEAKPVVKPDPKLASSGSSSGYFVQVGAHKTRAAAESIQKRLQSGGHNVTVTVATTSSGTWYRVRVGPFDAAGAKDFADRARQQKYQVAVIPPPKGDSR
ncbi:MAG: SPOR domain-containing protein [Burkholderiaceae bacterium]